MLNIFLSVLLSLLIVVSISFHWLKYLWQQGWCKTWYSVDNFDNCQLSFSTIHFLGGKKMLSGRIYISICDAGSSTLQCFTTTESTHLPTSSRTMTKKTVPGWTQTAPLAKVTQCDNEPKPAQDNLVLLSNTRAYAVNTEPCLSAAELRRQRLKSVTSKILWKLYLMFTCKV